MLLKLISIDVLRMDDFNADWDEIEENGDVPDPFDYYEVLRGPFEDPYDQRKPFADMIPSGTSIPFQFDASCHFDMEVLDIPRDRVVKIHVLDTVFPHRRNDVWEDGCIQTNEVPETLHDASILVQRYQKQIDELYSS